MKTRTLGKTGIEISEIGLGTWQVGGKWGSQFNHKTANEILNTAIDNGINFIDTADVYGDRESEKAVGRVIKERNEKIWVATKCGRRLSPHTNDMYSPARIRSFVEQSLQNMGLETLDLIQLHCPPTEVYYRPEIFETFDRLKEEGKIRNMGVSVEKVEEGIKAIEYPNVSTIQIIFNIFRQRPSDLLFTLAKQKNIGIIVRVPLASGLLSGKFNKQTNFDKDDHRFFNRDGSAFDKGETFSGLNYEFGIDCVQDIKDNFPDIPIHILALKYILMFDEVSCVIPGASNSKQVTSNLQINDYPDLTSEQMTFLKDYYTSHIRQHVHQLW